jgi:hypothetical protein
MTTATAQSRHSLRSIRRKLARRGSACASTGSLLVFDLWNRNGHLMGSAFTLGSCSEFIGYREGTIRYNYLFNVMFPNLLY